MARVFVKWQISITFLDVGNDLTTKTYELLGTDYDEASTNAIALVTAFQNVTGAAVIGYNVSGVFEEDTLVAPTGAGFMNSVQAIITGAIDAQPNKHATLTIPAPLDLVFTASTGSGRDIVNVTNSFVLALVAKFQAGTAIAKISDGEEFDPVPQLKGIRRTVFRRLAKQ